MLTRGWFFVDGGQGRTDDDALAFTNWKGTLAGTLHAGKLFTVEASGCLYETLLNNAKWKQVGKADFANTRFLFSAAESPPNLEANGNLKNVQRLPAALGGEALYSIEAEGSLYRIKLK
jgi:hypothetical protein